MTTPAGTALGVRVGVVVVAAGSGSRLGAAVPKAFAELCGRPLVSYAVATVEKVPGLTSVVLVVPPDHVDPGHPDWGEPGDLSDAAGGDRGIARDRVGAGHPVGAGWLPRDVRLVAGGAERTDSVAAGRAALDPTCDVILVHDAARCLTPLAVFERVVSAVVGGMPAVVPGVAVVDTIKVVDPSGLVVATPERSGLQAVQTPQGFGRAALIAAHATGLRATDDAALAELAGIPVHVVEGDRLAFKITTADDLAAARRAIEDRAGAP